MTLQESRKEFSRREELRLDYIIAKSPPNLKTKPETISDLLFIQPDASIAIFLCSFLALILYAHSIPAKQAKNIDSLLFSCDAHERGNRNLISATTLQRRCVTGEKRAASFLLQWVKPS